METVLTARHIRMPMTEVVEALAHILGAPLVAVLGGAKNTRSVRQWIKGDVLPAQETRLRAALQIADIILTREKPDVVRAWFAGNDPYLDDRSPLILLAEAESLAVHESVIAAARKFISET